MIRCHPIIIQKFKAMLRALIMFCVIKSTMIWYSTKSGTKLGEKLAWQHEMNQYWKQREACVKTTFRNLLWQKIEWIVTKWEKPRMGYRTRLNNGTFTRWLSTTSWTSNWWRLATAADDSMNWLITWENCKKLQDFLDRITKWCCLLSKI